MTIMELIKAITLYQPWASLVVSGWKAIETRSWGTRYRGMIAIHASKAYPKWVADLCSDYPMNYYLGRCGITHPEQLPRGAVLGVADLVRDVIFDRENTFNGWSWIAPNGRFYDFNITPREAEFGNYDVGRHGLLLADPIKFREPIADIRGALGLWNLDRALLPPEALAGYWEGRAM